MNDEELNKVLHTWKAEAELPASFQREVWHRIEAAKPSALGSMNWLEVLFNWLAKPLPAVAVCALAIGSGLVAGGMVGDTPPPSAVAAYADSINPLSIVSSQ